MCDYYDRQGNPITLEEWANLYTDNFNDTRRVDATELPGGVSVSTVHLGLDHQWGDGPPLIFETMIFGGPLDQDTWRYSTEEEAKAGHTHAVSLAEAANAARFMGADS